MNIKTVKKEEEKYYYTFLDIYDYTSRVCVKLEYKKPPNCIGKYSVFEIKEVLNDDSNGLFTFHYDKFLGIGFSTMMNSSIIWTVSNNYYKILEYDEDELKLKLSLGLSAEEIMKEHKAKKFKLLNSI